VSAEKALTTILLTTLLFSIIPFTTAQEEFEWNRRIPFIGAQPTLVLMVQFSDVRMSISRAQAEQIVKVVDNFVRTSSYGRTWLEYTIHPRVLTLPKPMAYYGGPSQGAQRGDDNARILEYHLTTIRLAKQEGLDLSNYKHIIVIHAGKDEAAGGTANDIWSHCHCVAPKILYFLIEQYGFDVVEAELRKNPQTQWAVELFMHRTRDGRGHLIAGIETVAEFDIPSTMAHEFTHSMWIPDHYVYRKDGYSGGSEVGVWTNMDYGPFLDPPVDIDGWSKYLLGWIEAVTVEQNGEYTIHTLDKPDEPHGLINPDKR
jgi:M6 family metalloprotease-like protein